MRRRRLRRRGQIETSLKICQLANEIEVRGDFWSHGFYSTEKKKEHNQVGINDEQDDKQRSPKAGCNSLVGLIEGDALVVHEIGDGQCWRPWNARETVDEHTTTTGLSCIYKGEAEMRLRDYCATVYGCTLARAMTECEHGELVSAQDLEAQQLPPGWMSDSRLQCVTARDCGCTCV